ncbi:MAG: hydroxymethylglutaryl-CoA lyase [Syntrophales bacterium]|nr:hydroxymethylglutaryl-CoA lyase [Syntrophales bacterium]
MAVEITEVGPRDGFQNIKPFIPTERKIHIIEKLADCGLKRIEITSFVHPRTVPQMADAADVLMRIKQEFAGRITCIALAPNLLGAERAIASGADEITFVISASDRHNLENTQQTIKQSLAAFASVCKIKGSVLIRLSVATAFTCPFTGEVPAENVMKIIETGMTAGADEVMLADTVGNANPLQIEALLELLMPRFSNDFVLHIHDTQGMGLANILTALTMGITRYETSIGGLGGCPFAPGAAGNIATEDLVNMCHQMNIETGIDLKKLIEMAGMLETTIPASLSGHLSHASCISGSTGMD